MSNKHHSPEKTGSPDGKPHPTDVYVGRRVREVRIMRGLSQQQLGAKLNLSFQQVQKYEKGTNRIGSSRLWELSRILDVSIGHFFEGLEDADESTDGPSAAISRRALRLAKEIDSVVDPDVQGHFIELVRAYNVSPEPSD